MQQQGGETLERILEIGRAAFLAQGFKDASLREIAKRAGVTTGAIYGYFPDKEALFTALVEPVAGEMLARFTAAQVEFDALPAEERVRCMHRYSRKSLDEILDFVFDHFEVFRLIICCADGTRYAGFVDRLVEVEEHYTHRFLDALRETGHPLPPISAQVIHILCSANFNGIFELVAHNIPREDARRHLAVLTEFFRAGWDRVMGLEGTDADSRAGRQPR